MGLLLITILILLFHPDAGQLTAFSCATALILWKKVTNWIGKMFSLALTAVFVGLSWAFFDHLAPVPYVEDIIFLVEDLGGVWYILGIFSLILLLCPFFFYGYKDTISLSLGVYFLSTMLVTLLGHFPLPVMGYGVSPVIGYLIAITWLNKNKRKTD